MALHEAERVFGKVTRLLDENDDEFDTACLRRNLRGLLIDHRIMSDSGLDRAVLYNPRSVMETRRHSAEQLTRQVQAPLTEVIPTCDRWNDVISAVAAVSRQRGCTTDVLGADTRSTLPMSIRAAGDGFRVGPGGTFSAEMESTWTSARKLADVLQDHDAPTGNLPDHCDVADAQAFLEDGFRMWPCRALSSKEASERVAALVSQTCDTIESVNPKLRLANGAGVYTKAWVMTLGGNVLQDVAKRHVLGLGAVLFTRDPAALNETGKHCFQGSMAAYCRGSSELGKQLERLGYLVSTLQRHS